MTLHQHFSYEVPTTDPENSETVVVSIYLREKKTTSNYSPTNLFGQPLMIGVPRNGTDYEKLYQQVMLYLSRFVAAPSPGDEWWKPTTNGETSVNGELKDWLPLAVA